MYNDTDENFIKSFSEEEEANGKQFALLDFFLNWETMSTYFLLWIWAQADQVETTCMFQ